jgi:hypothetical protein
MFEVVWTARAVSLSGIEVRLSRTSYRGEGRQQVRVEISHELWARIRKLVQIITEGRGEVVESPSSLVSSPRSSVLSGHTRESSPVES